LRCRAGRWSAPLGTRRPGGGTQCPRPSLRARAASAKRLICREKDKQTTEQPDHAHRSHRSHGFLLGHRWRPIISAFLQNHHWNLVNCLPVSHDRHVASRQPCRLLHTTSSRIDASAAGRDVPLRRAFSAHWWRLLSPARQAVLLGVLAAIAGAAALSEAACSPSENSASKTLVVALASAPQQLDPAQTTDAESADLLEQIFEHLVAYAPHTTKVVPSLATRWERQADGRTWRFFLRKGVQFHDGTPLNAEAVVYSFKRQRRNVRLPSGALRFPYESSYRNIVDIQAESSHVVRIVTDRPFAPLLASLAMFPVSIVSPKAFRAAEKGKPLRPAGTGPFEFVSRDKKTGRVILKAFPHYWGPKPGVDRVVFERIRNARQRLRALESGLVHIARNLPPEAQQLVRLHPDLRLAEMPAFNVVYVAMNTENRPFHDPRVRQAVNYAVRKEPILGLVYQGTARPAVGPLPPSMTPYYTDKVKRYDYNPKLARRLLAEAGYDKALRPKFYVMKEPRPYLPRPVLAARMIARDLAAVGMNVDLRVVPFAEEKRAMGLGKHHLALIGWSGDNGDPDNFLYTLLDADNAVPGNALNFAFYKEYRFHKLVLAARESLDEAERVRDYHKAQQIVAETCPWVPLAHAKVIVALRREVRNFQINPTAILNLGPVSLR